MACPHELILGLCDETHIAELKMKRNIQSAEAVMPRSLVTKTSTFRKWILLTLLLWFWNCIEYDVNTFIFNEMHFPFKKYYFTFLLMLAGKVALITGGANGLGECTAKLFAKHGAKIILADIQCELGHVVSEAIGSANSRFVHCDVSKEEDVKNTVDIAVKTYGKLDIVFNNAGILDPTKASITDNKKEDFDRVLSVNVTGVFLGMKHAARVMVPARSGSIISMSSIASEVGGIASHAYTCSKHAIVGLTKNLAVELGQFGIRVNCLSPYAMFTPLANNSGKTDGKTFENISNSYGNLKGVTLTTNDVANAALFLASNDAKYISGHNLHVDGRFSLASTANIFKNEENHDPTVEKWFI
ncbi:hypothetical protein L1987_00344 [Smallanthus sonchifolius]|uniref:Uncharacterized protein n=1 Tax=Smallanthus sonchifolius TaxID=185202 RepID=A0ACB9K231_9ASTR|nr:hypothetical protein L1987_00344 [Smallanthus sonchifolius]